MYKYLISIDAPEGSYTCELLNDYPFTQEQFTNIVNSTISKYMIDNDYTTVFDYDMNAYIVEDLINNYRFVKPKDLIYQAKWNIGWRGIELGFENDKYRSAEDMAILTDIRNRVNEKDRTKSRGLSESKA